jgi:hypothetical protein
MVLQQVEMLDQEVAPPFAFTEQHLHLGESGRVDLPSLRLIGPAPPSRARVDAAVVRYGSSHFMPPPQAPLPSKGRRGRI